MYFISYLLLVFYYFTTIPPKCWVKTLPNMASINRNVSSGIIVVFVFILLYNNHYSVVGHQLLLILGIYYLL